MIDDRMERRILHSIQEAMASELEDEPVVLVRYKNPYHLMMAREGHDGSAMIMVDLARSKVTVQVDAVPEVDSGVYGFRLHDPEMMSDITCFLYEVLLGLTPEVDRDDD